MKKQMKHTICCTLGAVAIGLLTACGSPQSETALLQAGVSRELAQYRKDNFGQVRYRLFFSIPEQRGEAITGTAEISLVIKEKQPVIIDFRGEPGQVSSVLLNEKEVPYTFKDEHIVIDAGEVSPGENRVSIAFTAIDQSLNRRDEFLYTLLVPDRARTLFPCFDQPDMKSLFSLTLEVPQKWQAIANGAIQETDSVSVPGRKRISFRETEPLSTYLFSFVAGELSRETYNREGREISLYHRETDPKKVAQCPEIAGEVFDALSWLEEYTGIPYPFAKYDFIILPGFQYGGMEHTGATLYNDRRMFLNENPTLNERLGRSALIAHETAHMWFGDYVTMEWFDDVWTKEVFANYYASQVVEPLYPEVDHRLNFMLDYLPPSYSEDRTAGANPIKQDLDNLRNAGLAYGNIIYDKSPVVMAMLIRMMGEDAYRKGIQEYLKTYAYGNATWEGLIGILDTYTDHDLQAWSHVWVHEKGMPDIRAEIKGDSLIVSQKDSWGRGLLWPQDITYQLYLDSRVDTITVSFDGKTDVVTRKLDLPAGEKYTLIPNTDGTAYGFFRLTPQEAEDLLLPLQNTPDDVFCGSLLITLYENLLNRTIPSEWYIDAMLEYLSEERNPLLFSSVLGYIGNCQRLYPVDAKKPEEALWKIVQEKGSPGISLQAFRMYRSLAETPEAIGRLYKIWKEQKAPGECSLSESDYIGLSYKLAMYLPEQADEIVSVQQSRIINPDRKKEYAFISPSVSPQKEVRDSVFNALLVAENRRIEPWASAALANVNSKVWQKEAVSYIRPGLEALQEVQRTGDIFFPTAWVRALLSGHTSAEARKEVDTFFANNPDYPVMLSNKIRQQADHLYRLKE
jgi:hypothetical protein